MEDNDLNEVFEGILHEFPVKKVAIKFPDWLQILDYTSDIIKNIIENVEKTYNAVLRNK